jgi:hypothetical protein
VNAMIGPDARVFIRFQQRIPSTCLCPEAVNVPGRATHPPTEAGRDRIGEVNRLVTSSRGRPGLGGQPLAGLVGTVIPQAFKAAFASGVLNMPPPPGPPPPGPALAPDGGVAPGVKPPSGPGLAPDGGVAPGVKPPSGPGLAPDGGVAPGVKPPPGAPEGALGIVIPAAWRHFCIC